MGGQHPERSGTHRTLPNVPSEMKRPRSWRNIPSMTGPLVPTGDAAKALGVGHSTLHRWWQEGTVIPTLVTPGGHARWDLDDLREQLRAQRRGDSPTSGQASG